MMKLWNQLEVDLVMTFLKPFKPSSHDYFVTFFGMGKVNLWLCFPHIGQYFKDLQDIVVTYNQGKMGEVRTY